MTQDKVVAMDPNSVRRGWHRPIGKAAEIGACVSHAKEPQGQLALTRHVRGLIRAALQKESTLAMLTPDFWPPDWEQRNLLIVVSHPVCETPLSGPQR